MSGDKTQEAYGPSPHSTDLSQTTTQVQNYDCEAGSQRSDGSKKREDSGLIPSFDFFTELTSGLEPWLRRVTSSFRPQPKIPDIESTEVRSLESCPRGYPRTAAFLSSEPSFGLYRGFHYLHSRVLLDLQAEIELLEAELDRLDDVDGGVDDGERLMHRALDLREPRTDRRRPRAEVMKDLRRKLTEYDEMLIKARDVGSFQRPSTRDYRSVRTWFYNEEPFVTREATFIQRKEDVVSLRSGREWSTFDGLVERCLRRFDCSLFRKIFCTRELRDKTSDSNIYYYSSQRVELFVGLIITFIIFILLVLPVFGMYKLTSVGQGPHGTFEAIGVLVVFTLLFCAAMSMLTAAKRHELFAATAGYCAILVVFITNFSGGGNSSGPGRSG